QQSANPAGRTNGPTGAAGDDESVAGRRNAPARGHPDPQPPHPAGRLSGPVGSGANPGSSSAARPASASTLDQWLDEGRRQSGRGGKYWQFFVEPTQSGRGSKSAR